jgi:hypothetical protein
MERYEPIIEDGKYVGLTEYGDPMELDRICRKVIDLEDYRNKKNRKIAKYRKREEKFQRVIGGLLAFLELRLNEELWWNLNEE